MVVLKNFSTDLDKFPESNLVAKWAFMDTSDDLKSVDIIDSKGENLGKIHRTNEADTKGDNYFLTIGENQIMGHKEEKGWNFYQVTNNGFHLAPIDNNSVRANNLKAVFFEARTALKSSGRKARTTPISRTVER